MKKLLVALAVGVAVFAAVFASAATLGLTTDNLGADDKVVASCDNSVTITYQTSYSATNGTYKIDSVTLDGVDAGCSGETIKVTISGASNASLAEVTQLATAAASQTITVTTYVNPELVEGIHVVISGPSV